jgi:CheY-like chemotaxis protein
VVSIVSVQRGQLWRKRLPGCLENMKQGRLLLIIDDARVSRLICRVAERFGMSYLAIKKTDDIDVAYKKSRPDIILLDPEPYETQGRDVLRKLAEQRTYAAIVMTNISPDHTGQLEGMGDSFDLNIVGALPDFFDADILKQKFNSIPALIDQHRYIAEENITLNRY